MSRLFSWKTLSGAAAIAACAASSLVLSAVGQPARNTIAHTGADTCTQCHARHRHGQHPEYDKPQSPGEGASVSPDS